MLTADERTAAHAWICVALAVDPAELEVRVDRERGW